MVAASLENLGTTPHIARWMVEQFDGSIGDRVLEAGSGTGNLHSVVVGQGADRGARRRPLVRAPSRPSVRTSRELLRDRGQPRGSRLCSRSSRERSSIPSSVSTCSSIWIGRTSPCEDSIGSFAPVAKRSSWFRPMALCTRRWTRPSNTVSGMKVRNLRTLLEDAGFEVERLSQFNRLGVVGWSVNRWIGRTSISRSQVFAFRLMMPLARALEQARKLRGLSWIAVARKDK